MDEVIALIQAEMKRTSLTPRLYMDETGVFDTIAMEWELENMAEHENSGQSISLRQKPTHS